MAILFTTTLVPLLIFSTTAALATAPVTTSFLLLDTDPQPLVASIIAFNPAASATTYSINCPAGEDADDCGYGPGATLTLGGSSLYDFTMTDAGFAASVHCDLAGTTSAVCIQSNGGSGANFPGVTTETLAASDMSYFPVTITAGLEKLTSEATTASGAASTSSAASAVAAASTAAAVTSSVVVTSAGRTASSTVVTSLPVLSASSSVSIVSRSDGTTTTAAQSTSGDGTQTSTASAAQQTDSAQSDRKVASGAGLVMFLGVLATWLLL